jgi:hypothetical protein
MYLKDEIQKIIEANTTTQTKLTKSVDEALLFINEIKLENENLDKRINTNH